MADVKVRYKGMSDVRILPADQLKERGVKGIDEDLVFGPNNMWAQTVPMSDELEAILRQDGAFSIEPVTDSGEPGDEVVTATGEDDTGNTVVMPDGQIDTKKE